MRRRSLITDRGVTSKSGVSYWIYLLALGFVAIAVYFGVDVGRALSRLTTSSNSTNAQVKREVPETLSDVTQKLEKSLHNEFSTKPRCRSHLGLVKLGQTGNGTLSRLIVKGYGDEIKFVQVGTDWVLAVCPFKVAHVNIVSLHRKEGPNWVAEVEVSYIRSQLEGKLRDTPISVIPFASPQVLSVDIFLSRAIEVEKSAIKGTKLVTFKIDAAHQVKALQFGGKELELSLIHI